MSSNVARIRESEFADFIVRADEDELVEACQDLESELTVKHDNARCRLSERMRQRHGELRKALGYQ
jgi:hypothetical protein